MPTTNLRICCAREQCDNWIIMAEAGTVGLYSDPPPPEVKLDEAIDAFGWTRDGSRTFCPQHAKPVEDAPRLSVGDTEQNDQTGKKGASDGVLFQ